MKEGKELRRRVTGEGGKEESTDESDNRIVIVTTAPVEGTEPRTHETSDLCPPQG
jgi:hypothetical protein